MQQKDEIGPINLGNPTETTIIELAEMVLRLTKSKSRLRFTRLPDDDPIYRQPSISKATKSLGGWKPAISLEDGLKETILYLENFLFEK